MDVIERLTLEAAQADTMLACEHRHRYAFAAPLCDGRSVLDLCCGSGYGSAILSEQARLVVGIDNDAATIETAQATVGRERPNTSFQAADALAYLHSDAMEQFEVVVCFEGLEHLPSVDRALARLGELAERGLRLIVSIPNSKMFHERNPFHVTDFGYREALAAFVPFPSALMLPQFLAEGSLICPVDANGTDVTVTLDGRDEPEYANHFIFCVNVDGAEVENVHHGRIQVTASPLFNRWSEGMKQALAALRRENARLARARLGKSSSAAASALAKLNDHEAQVEALTERCRLAETRVSELESELARNDGVAAAEPQPFSRQPAAVTVVTAPPQGRVAADAAGEDPNSWDCRRRRAEEFLIPWIEQSVPLTGKTVLEYGCGNAAVGCAFAERAERLIGVDIDSDAIEAARTAVRDRDLDNVELELHPVESILDAVARRRGEVDVFLCYAVLEHLTVSERLELLRLARQVVRPEGAIVVCETPNRLIYFDHHTAQIPFQHLLPDELAVDYASRSARPDFRAAIESAVARGPSAALEAIARWGRGVSFHEFELAFEAPLDRHVISSNYDPILFPERPVHPDEVILARYLERWRPDLPPVFSRYWLDLILSPRPLPRRPTSVRPWTAQTVHSRQVGWTETESLHLTGPESTLWVTLPHPTNRLVVGLTARAERVQLSIRGELQDAASSASVPVAPGEQTFASFSLGEPAQRIAVGSDQPCELVFVGYED
jgi:2-polyprenyl-3-methyl-5-hydroxy-6-metoxy-1,4-benzoquinol methylase